MPAATIDVAVQWGGLIAHGVHASREELMKVMYGAGAERLQAIERASGAFIWASKDSARLFLSGDAPAIARARAAIDALVTPAVTIDIAAQWGALIADGTHASKDAIIAVLYGARAERVTVIQQSSGAAVWRSRDGARLLLSGDAPGVAAARAALDALVVPAVTIDVPGEWSSRIADGGHASSEGLMVLLHGVGMAELSSRVAVWASGDGARMHVSGGDAGAVRRARDALVAAMMAKSA